MLRTTLLVAASLLVASTTVLSQPAGPQRKVIKREIQMRESLKERLKLTDAQESQMRKLRIELQKKQTALNAKIRIARLDMRELMFAEKPDKGAIEKKIKEVSGLQEQVKLNRLDHWFAVNNILTPEQQKVFREGVRKGAQGKGRMMRRMGPPMGDMSDFDTEIVEPLESE